MARNDIIVKLRLAGEEFAREFDRKFDDAFENAEKKSTESGRKSGGGFAKGFLGAAGIGALGAAIGTAISESADLGAEIASTSRQFNIGAEELQVWRFAAQQAGVTASEFDGSLSDLTQKIGQANAGNRAAQQSFADLGIGFQTTAGQARATDAVMLDLAERIAAIEDPSERVRLGTQLLGQEFETLYPLLLDGAAGFQEAAADLDKFGGVLSREEIQNLQQTNAKIEQMKSVLSIKIAGVVAENADAIIGMTTALAEFGGQAIAAANDWLTFRNTLSQYKAERDALPGNLSGQAKADAIEQLDARFGRRERVTGSFLGGLFQTKEVEFRPDGQFDDISLITDANRREVASLFENPRGVLEPSVATPRVTGGGGRSGGGGTRRSPTETAAEREAERAAKEALRNEEQLRDAIGRTLRAQQDSAEVERIRAEQGEIAAAVAEAELAFLRQHPLAVNDTVEALAAALGITRELTQADKDRLQVLIDQGDVAQGAAGDAARAKAEAEADRAADREAQRAQDIADRQAEYFRRAQEIAIFDVAGIYETAMRGGVDGLWDYFKDEGFRIIAEVAAQYTLAMIAGQPFDFNAASAQALGRSPLSSIFFGSGAANDNGLAVPGFGGGVFGVGGRARGSVGGGLLPSGGVLPTGGAPIDATFTGGASSLLSTAGTALGIAGIAFSLAQPLIGLFGKGAAGTANIGGAGGSLGVLGTSGGSGQRRDSATGLAGSVLDAIDQIAQQLGGGVNASAGRVSIGLRDDDIRVDPTGRGRTKIGDGAIDFGQDQEAAIAFAVQDLIQDGVITGISQAGQNLLRKGGDLETQLEKALLIESVPRLLEERLDPLGAALDQLYDKFKLLADAMREGGASAEQVAEAQRLWELEKADAIASVGAASQTLADFLASLNAGSNSPLSLRQQRAEAERQLDPFLTQISAAEAARADADRLRASGASAADIEAAETAARTAAAAIDQSGFTQASQLLLSISRQTGASSGAFFSDFDRIRALTGQAIGFVDQASARDADTRDPFGSAIAKNTEDAAYILAENTALLREIRDAMNDNGSGLGSGGGFTRDPRLFAVR